MARNRRAADKTVKAFTMQIQVGAITRRGRAKAVLLRRAATIGVENMIKGLVASAFGAAVLAALVALPANAQDDLAEKTTVCGACHGQSGEPVSGNTPIIWGQQSNFLYKELHDYHSGERANPIMSPLAKNFSFQDLRSIANYFAAKTWPAKQGGGAPAGAEPEGITMCKACHGQKFEGGQPAPRLAGQGYEYLISAMDAFADNLDMPGFMKALTESQRQAIAHYLSSL
jgi:cytochrome c553